MRTAQSLHFTTHDGVELHYRHWPANRQPGQPRRAVVLFHRGHEHGGRMAHLVDELDLPGHDFFAWDARGQGESPGARGDSPSFACSVRDVQTFIEHIAREHAIDEQDMAVLAAQVDALLDAGPMWGYLIDGHGLYAWGKDLAEARRHLEAFDFLLDCELELRRLTAGH